jgi:hypothetical protein
MYYTVYTGKIKNSFLTVHNNFNHFLSFEKYPLLKVLKFFSFRKYSFTPGLPVGRKGSGRRSSSARLRCQFPSI